MVDKYETELVEILYELLDFRPHLVTAIGCPEQFNWRAIFDFSSNAWAEYDRDFRTAVINGLAEKGSLFLSMMTYKSMYMEMGRPDIAGAAGLSMARFLENVVSPDFADLYSDGSVALKENHY